MHRTKTAARAALVAAAALALVGCTPGAVPSAPQSPSSTSTPSTAPTPSTNAATPSTPATPSPAPTASDPVAAPVPTADPADTAHPTLTYAGRTPGSASYQLAGVVPDVIEDGGSCVFRLRSGGAVVERTQSGLADASSTSCGTVEVPATELARGSWDATLTYQGTRGSGTSPVLTVVVP